MKRIFYLLFLLGGVIHTQAQTLSIFVGNPGCYYSNATTSVMVTQTVSGASSYSWSSYSLSGGCTNTFNTLSNGQYGGITFGCCGSHTIVCTALNASMTPIASTGTVISIGCPPSVVVVSMPTLVCAGSPATLYAGGANSYTWTNGSTPISYSPVIVVTPTATTCYTLIGANSQGCITSTVKCVTVSSAPSISISGPSVICAGDTVHLTASGASTYTWSNNSTGSNMYAMPFSNTCYTVIGTNSQGCTGYAVKCVTVSSSSNIYVTGSSSICAGYGANLYATGGTSYTWTPGGMTGNIITVYPTSSTCYTVYASGACGNGSAVKCITVTPGPTISISGGTTVCQGQSATLTATGAQSYTWYPSMATSSTIVMTPTATTCFSIQGTGSNGCPGWSGACITVQSAAINVSGPSSICSGNSAVLTATGSGSYTWQPGNLTGSSVTVSPTSSTCYTVTGYNGGCTSSNVKCITVGSGASVTATGPSVVCSGYYSYFFASGASSYTWYPTMQTGSQILASPSVGGCYTVVGTTSAGCVGSAYVCFSLAPSPTITISGNAVICGGSSATLTASGGSSYTWFPSANYNASIVVSPSVSTCYTVMGYNGYCNATAIKCVTVSNSNISVAGPNSICSGQSATITASGSTSYTWQPGNLTGSSIVVSPTATTCYTVTGMSGTNTACSSSTVKCISVNPYPVITTGSNGFCAGQSGQIFASGASSYTWYPFNTTGSMVTISPTVSGCYTVVGTNSTGCMSSAFGCYSVFTTPSLSVSGPSVMCPNTSATLIASGASSYTWIPGGMTGSVVVVSPTASVCYTIFGTVPNGCLSNTAKCITIQNGSLTISGPNAICSGNTVTLTATGATSYTWQPGNLTGASIVVSPSVATCYTVTGSISGGNCQASAVKCLGVGTTPNITTNAGAYCAGQTAVFTAQGATSYTWIPFNLTGSSVAVTPTTSGCFTVIGINSSGCTGTAVNCYSIIPAPTLSISGNTFLCPGDSTILTASGASSYTWLPGGNTGPNLFIAPMSSTCYTVIASNGFCTSSALKCVQVSPSPSVTISGSNYACTGNPLVLVASGANSYLWSNGATTPTIVVTPTASGCFTVTGSNGPNCTSSAVKCFSVINSVSLTIGGLQTICRGQLANITVSGAQTYTWNTGSNSNVLFVSPAFNTVYTVTGSIGSCSQTRTVQVIVNQSPTITIASSHSVVCPGGTAILVAAGAQTYTWLANGATSPSIAVSPSVTTSYVVNGTSAQGCVGASTIMVVAGQCTGIEEAGLIRPAFTIFPNPALNNVTLTSTQTASVKFTVFDMLGRAVLAGEFSSAKTVDISNLAGGNYIVHLESGNNSQYQRLIVEK